MLDIVKYPRTMHLPWSESLSNDDRVISDLSILINSDVVVTEKMDGENTSMYRDYIHARSMDSSSHPSRAWVKNFWNGIRFDIPNGWRICGENLYAKHSIEYDNLLSYFYGFSIWNEENVCLSWDDIVEWLNIIGIVPVPVLYRGIFNKNVLIELGEKINRNYQEGYVVRCSNSFRYEDFDKKVAKYVRKNHVQTDEHWMYSEIVKNKIMVNE